MDDLKHIQIGNIAIKCDIPGKISLEWEIPGASLLMAKRKVLYSCPAFDFSHRKWCLGLGQTLDETGDTAISLFSTKHFKILMVDYSLSLKDINGGQKHIRRGSCQFDSTCDSVSTILPTISKLAKSKLLPSDTLTVQCMMDLVSCEEEIGEISTVHPADGEIAVEWRIGNRSTLSEKGAWFHSPNFHFASSLWCLRLDVLKTDISVWQEKGDSADYVTYDLRLKSSRTANENVEDCFERRFPFTPRWLSTLSDYFSPGGEMTVECHMRIVHPILLKTDHLIQDFRELLITGKGSDVILKVKEKEHKAHRLILRLRLPEFSAEFERDLRNGFVLIEGCDPDTYSEFLHFIYTGSVEEFSVEKAASLYSTADKHRHLELKKVCLEYMKENIAVSCFCDIMAVAILHKETKLCEMATEFFLNHSREIVTNCKWKSFLRNNIDDANDLIVKLVDFYEGK